jgi:hypothetical protein
MSLLTIWLKIIRAFRVKSLRNELIMLLPLLWVVVKLVKVNKDVIVLLNHDAIDLSWIVHNHEAREDHRWLHPECFIKDHHEILEVLNLIESEFPRIICEH